MKRILILLLVLSLVFCFVACNEEEPTTDPTPETTPAADADLKAAYDLVHNLSKDITEATGANYDLVGSVKVKDKNYKVNWTVTVADNQVTLQTSEDGLTVTVVVPSNEPNADIPYTLKFTVTNEKGESLSREYSHYVPKFKVNTHEEYLAASTNDPLVVEGIVVAINSKAAGNSRNHLFLADATVTGGYYIYQMDVDPVADLGIQVGMTVRVTGPASPYSGMQEIKGGVPEIIDTTIKTVPTVDITAAFASGADLKAYVGLPVTIKGVTIGDQELGGTSDYLNFSLNGKESYVRSYKTDLPTSFTDLAAAKAAIEAAHASHFNWSADVTGILVLYSGNPYLIPMTEDCFNFLQAQEMSDAEKVANSLNAITVPGKVTSDTTITLPAVGQNFADVVLSWTLEANDAAALDGTTLTLTVPESKTTVTITVTATLGEVTETKTFTIELSKEATPVADIIALGQTFEHNTYTADKYLVAGVITEVYNETYGNMKITDAYGNVLTIYGTYDATGATRYDAMTTKPVAGDYVVVLGVVGQYSGTSQVKNGWIQSFTTPTSVADAIATGAAKDHNTYTEEKHVVTGEITEIYNTQYGNMKIKDAAGNILTVYGTYDSTGANRFDAMSKQPAVGDTITVYGVLGQYSGTAQMKNGWIMQVVAGTTSTCEHTNTETATTDATCTVAGSTTVTCTDCGEVVSTTEIPATGHTMGAATCVAPATCSVCGHTEGEPAGHNFVEGTCSVCGTTETHECNFVAGETVAPTCTEAGYTVYNCTCGATENRDEVAATGHDEVTTTVDSTCAVAGYTVLTCATCEVELGERTTLEKLPHTDANGDFKCDVCSDKVLPADGEALTIAQALAIGKLYTKDTYTTTKYYITGVITEVQNVTYGNVVISDGTNTILVYGLYDATGKTRYDALSYKPVKGDEITVYGVIGFYSAAQMKNGWLDEVVAHDHDYDHVVTAPTCTVAGYTTHTCAVCDHSYKDTEVEALGHTTDNGVCDNCGQTLTPGVATKDTFTADFNTVAANTSYGSYTTTDGWKTTNCAVAKGGPSNAQPQFVVVGDADNRGFILNGKTTAKGKVVSPTLEGGLSKITFNYANVYSESKGVDITVTIKQNGQVVATKQLDNNSVTQHTAYEFVWDLEAEGVAVTGDFTIEITNNSPTNSTSNKDRVCIFNLQWTNNPEA